MIVYPPGTPNWVDLSSTDLSASQAFYSELFGWEVVERAPAEMNGGYWTFTKGGADVAGIGPSQVEGAPPFWTTYVAVEDADAHHAQAVAAGAEITTGLTDQDYGSRDYAAKDPEGNQWNFGTYRPA